MKCFVLVVAFALAGTLTLVAQARRVTVVLISGEVVEGALRSATDRDVTIEIAGRTMTLPTSDVKYISFVGRVEAAVSSGAPSSRSLDQALASLATLRGIVQVGILRSFYSQKLVELLPVVNAFLNEPSAEWADVKGAMQIAVENYRKPLEPLGWPGNSDVERADLWGRYAADLASRPDEIRHRESPAEVSVEKSGDFKGRLGTGDYRFQRGQELEPFSDQYVVTLTTPSGPLVARMQCTPCIPRLTLVDEKGRVVIRVGGGADGSAEISRTMSPGRYRVLAGSSFGFGDYSLSLAFY